jgi:hypothetical protein
MKRLLKAYLKKFVSDLHAIILSAIFAALFLGAGGIWFFSKTLWVQLVATMALPTPLWVTIIFLVLFVLAYIYLRNKTSIPLSTPDPEWREEFHVRWDKNNKMRCLYCGSPLKGSSLSNPSIFNCSNPNCGEKHVLQDKQGKKMTEQEAIDQMPTASGHPQDARKKLPVSEITIGTYKESLLAVDILAAVILEEKSKPGVEVFLKRIVLREPYCPNCSRTLDTAHASWMADGVQTGYRCSKCNTERKGTELDLYKDVDGEVRRNFETYWQTYTEAIHRLTGGKPGEFRVD